MNSLIISKTGIAVVLNLLIFYFSYAKGDPDTLRLNLALVDPGSTRTIQGNRIYDRIILENLVNGYAYSLEIRNEPKMLPPLESVASVRGADKLSSGCNELEAATKELRDFQEAIHNPNRNEKDLSYLTYAVDVLLNMKKCDDGNVTQNATNWLGNSERVIEEKISIETGKVVTIIIKRGTLEWKFIFEGDAPGKWVTTYGFGFTANALRGNSYYTKQLPDTSVFEILKTRCSKAFDLSYVPAVFFTFFPSKSISKSWNCSLTGGLGFDLVSPVIYFGYNVIYWHNIGFSAGLAFQQQNVLKDKYEVNESVPKFLETNELHDKVYRPNLFISFHFRLDKNPFNKE